MSDHMSLEIAAAVHRGSGLAQGEPVPGCGCPTCTGLPDDHRARMPAWRRANPEAAAARDCKREERWTLRVEAARALGVVEIAERLGCGQPVRRGNRLAVRCPLHEDHDPSCTLDPQVHLWYCFVCAEGGDGIRLYMRARRLTFVAAVRKLVP